MTIYSFLHLGPAIPAEGVLRSDPSDARNARYNLQEFLVQFDRLAHLQQKAVRETRCGKQTKGYGGGGGSEGEQR